MGVTARSNFRGVSVYDEFDRDGEAEVRINTEWCWLDRDGVRELRDHLNTLLGDAPAAKAETVVVEVGREYRLLPGARSVTNAGPESCFEDVTRARVETTADSDGDVRVTVLDGKHAGTWGASGWYIGPKYLAPLDDPTPAPDAARAARIVAGKAEQVHHYMTARWFREFADLLEGKSL